MKSKPTASLSKLEFALLNRFQRDFPLLPRPFATLADTLETSEATVIEHLRQLQQEGLISRIGAVFRPHAIGASALAALPVPDDRMDEVARRISAFAEVNHNYEREHRFNLWFVVTASSAERLQTVLHEIEDACHCGPVLILPMLAQYHIDLGFDLSPPAGHCVSALTAAPSVRHDAVSLSTAEQVLVAALQDGLPLVERPFACLGLPEAQAIDTVAHWLALGVIKRFGVVVRHHELGYTANAMVVWDIPDEMVDEVGQRIAASGRVTLCYRRPRQLPDWHYNLFCMIHGKDRSDVAACIAALADACGLAAYPRDVLFSRRRFKQRGAHYAPASAPAPETAHG